MYGLFAGTQRGRFREVTVSGGSTVLKQIITNLQVVAGAADAISACVVDKEVR